MTDIGVDGVIVVNLDRRPERWDEFRQTWADILPWDRVERLSASDGVALAGYGERPWFRGRKRDRTWAGRAGCTLSHARALRLARSRGWTRVLVMEDDAVPTEAIGALPAVLAASDAAMIYLGGHEPIGPFGARKDGLIGIGGSLETHAYVASADLADWLVDRLPDEAGVWAWVARERAIDRWYRREIGRAFPVALASPPLAIQREGVSDIAQTWRAADHSDWSEGASEPRWLFEVRRAVERVGDQARAGLKRLSGF